MAEGVAATSESVPLHLSRAAHILQGSDPALRNNVSSHKVKNPISFQALDTFCINATKPGGAAASQLYLASLDGGPVISARLRVEPDSAVRGGGKKKRGRDDAAEWIARLREAALQDAEGKALDGAIATVRSFV